MESKIEYLQSVINDFTTDNEIYKHYYSNIKIELVDMFSDIQKSVLKQYCLNDEVIDFKIYQIVANKHEDDNYYFNEIVLFQLKNNTPEEILTKLKEYVW